MTTRRGCGRVKHLDVKVLWCEEAIEKERFPLIKVDSDNSPADIGAKTPSADRIVRLPRLLGMDGCSSISVWTAVEPNEDDKMKELARSRCDAKVDSQRHGRVNAEDLRKQAKW